MQRIETSEAIFYQFEVWQNAPLKHGIFTRHKGVSDSPWQSFNLGGTVGDSPDAVQENHRRMFTALDMDSSRACTVWQVHGVDTIVVNAPISGRKWLNRADGMVTNQKNIPLVMRFADCMPILFYDPVQEVIGIAHAGWRGTVDGAQVSVVHTMQRAFGSHPTDIQAGIGPGIGPDSYQVGEEVVLAVEASFGTDAARHLIKRASDGSAYLNLWEANRLKLEQAGLQQIEVAEICTASRTDEFFSHRAEKGQTGRFGAVIGLI